MGKLILFSGAGLSAESGLATFRNSPDGLWENHSIDEVCSYPTWKRNYDLVHRFYNMRRTQLGTVEPNAAHRLIAKWQTQYETLILTQNVDDLLERAGCTNVVHLHGFLPEMHCELCNHVWRIDYTAWTAGSTCLKCSRHESVKPNVVFFGQDAPQYVTLNRALSDLKSDDVIVVAGTSEMVIPIGEYLYGRQGHKIFNALEPSLTAVYQRSLIMPATEAFPLIDAILQERLD
jgi:NAD-dependent deacetylase